MKETIAFGVELSAFVVDATIDLDDEASGSAVEVDDVAIDHELTAEGHAKLPTSQLLQSRASAGVAERRHRSGDVLEQPPLRSIRSPAHATSATRRKVC